MDCCFSKDAWAKRSGNASKRVERPLAREHEYVCVGMVMYSFGCNGYRRDFEGLRQWADLIVDYFPEVLFGVSVFLQRYFRVFFPDYYFSFLSFFSGFFCFLLLSAMVFSGADGSYTRPPWDGAARSTFFLSAFRETMLGSCILDLIISSSIVIAVVRWSSSLIKRA